MLKFQITQNGITTPTLPEKKESPSRQESVSEIQDILNSLTLEVSDQDLDSLLQCVESMASEEVTLAKMTDVIYEKCISDREFAKTGAFICEKITSLEVNGTKFRSLLLSRIQADYKGKSCHVLFWYFFLPFTLFTVGFKREVWNKS